MLFRSDEFIALNPGFSRPLIRASVTPRIVLPADKVEVFHANLSKYDSGSLVSWQAYYAKKGDTLESIAKHHGLALAQLREVNGISARTRAIPALLVVPVSSAAAAASTRRLPIMYAPPIPVAMRRVVHTVKAGETLPLIAKRYSVSVEDLKRWNRLGRLVAGQRLSVEVRAPLKGKPRPKAKGKIYKKSRR